MYQLIDRHAVGRIPREPFLRHSQQLFDYLVTLAGGLCGPRVLEIGCGRSSPLVPMLKRIAPTVNLTQVDARPDVVVDARRYCPEARVEQRFAHDLRGIADESQDAVVAMSVFDQNPAPLLSAVSAELRRVLRPGGCIIYLHNEELNEPATAASQLYESLQPVRLRTEPSLLVPSDRWQPTNDLEYATAPLPVVEDVLRRIGGQIGPLLQYLQAINPDPDQVAQSQSGTGHGRVTLRDVEVAQMQQFRAGTARLRRDFGVPLRDWGTTELLRERVERRLLGESEGWQLLAGGMYELRTSVEWGEVFPEPHDRPVVVRGVAKYGYLAPDPPPVRTEFHQVLNEDPQRTDNQVLLVGYQYGAVARKPI